MSITLRSNVASATAFNNVNRAGRGLTSTFARVSSGLRIASAADDAAGLGIAERLDAQARSGRQAARNINDGISALQVADGAASEIGDVLKRMRELAVQARNGTLDANARTNLNAEFTSLRDEITRIADNTNFNNTALTNTADALTIQVGTNAGGTNLIGVNRANLTATSLGVGASVVGTEGGADAAITAIDGALNTLATGRTTFGTGINRLESALRTMENYVLNTGAAESRIRDADMAFETAQMSRFQVMQQAGIAALAQANQGAQAFLRLL
jgi:flagellin